MHRILTLGLLIALGAVSGAAEAVIIVLDADNGYQAELEPGATLQQANFGFSTNSITGANVEFSISGVFTGQTEIGNMVFLEGNRPRDLVENSVEFLVLTSSGNLYQAQLTFFRGMFGDFGVAPDPDNMAGAVFDIWAIPEPSTVVLETVTYSPDVTVSFAQGSEAQATVNDEDVSQEAPVGSVTPLVIGSIPQATDLNAYFLFSNDDPPQRQLLSLDTTVELPGGLFAEPRDVVLFDDPDFSLIFDGSEEGIPNGVMVDAVSLIGANLLLSFDTTVALDGFTAEDEDVVSFSTVTGEFSEFFVGADAGVPADLDVDGFHFPGGGVLLISFDVSGEIPFDISIPDERLSFDDEDVLEFNPAGTWSLAYDGSFLHVGWGAADLDALHANVAVPPIPGDLDEDGDVDLDDMRIILAALNTPATGPDDPRDLDADGTITARDASKLRLLCTRPRCATS